LDDVSVAAGRTYQTGRDRMPEYSDTSRRPDSAPHVDEEPEPPEPPPPPPGYDIGPDPGSGHRPMVQTPVERELPHG
jgi:hypothetical protein